MKVVMIVNSDFATWHFRRGLISRLIDCGHDVLLLTPDGTMAGDTSIISKLTGLGARHITVPFYRFPSVWRDLKVLFQLLRILRDEKPDIIHNMAAKANIYGALAGKLAGVPCIVSLVCGVGYGFDPPKTARQRVLRFLMSTLYWLAGKATNRMWFLNEDDLELFVERKLIRREKTILICSEGVNFDEYSADSIAPESLRSLRAELGLDDSTQVVLMMVSRVTWSKGVKEFVEASQASGSWEKPVKFIMAGPLDPDSPDPVPAEYLNETSQFKWLDFRRDVVELLALSDVVALPSFYREGVPRTLLEAMAMKKPLVTTDNVGCRDTVDDGKTGYLIPVRDTEAFAATVKRLVEDDELRASFGEAGYRKAKQEFAEAVVNARVFKELYQMDYEANTQTNSTEGETISHGSSV